MTNTLIRDSCCVDRQPSGLTELKPFTTSFTAEQSFTTEHAPCILAILVGAENEKLNKLVVFTIARLVVQVQALKPPRTYI